MNRYSWAFLILFAAFSYPAVGQHAANVSFTTGTDQSGKSYYYISYDLIAPYNTIPCFVTVRGTSPSTPPFILQDVTGDVGHFIYPGSKKQLQWDHVKELVHYSDDVSISIEVVPDVMVPAKVKKGKQVPIQFSTAFANNITYGVSLYREQAEVIKLNDVLLSDSQAAISLPPKSKLRSKYQIKITEGANAYYSNTFRLRPKVGYGWKALPLLIIPIYILIKDHQEANEPLPGPPTDILN